jgi:hypothetical protein
MFAKVIHLIGESLKTSIVLVHRLREHSCKHTTLKCVG